MHYDQVRFPQQQSSFVLLSQVHRYLQKMRGSGTPVTRRTPNAEAGPSLQLTSQCQAGTRTVRQIPGRRRSEKYVTVLLLLMQGAASTHHT